MQLRCHLGTGVPDPYEQLKANLADVDRLMDVHLAKAGPSRGRKFDVAFLNKSGVVLAHACWEAFVEDCATAGFDHLISCADSPEVLPNGVRRLIAKRVKDDPSDVSPWRMAADGWRREVVAYRDDVVKKYVGPLNTPSPRNVDSLYAALLELSDLSSNWHWHRMTSAMLRQRLAAFTALRGDIAHRSASTRAVTKFDVTSNTENVLRVAGITSNRVRSHLTTLTGKAPWDEKQEPKPPGRPRRPPAP
jgi:hypothetical protein